MSKINPFDGLRCPDCGEAMGVHSTECPRFSSDSKRPIVLTPAMSTAFEGGVFIEVEEPKFLLNIGEALALADYIQKVAAFADERARELRRARDC